MRKNLLTCLFCLMALVVHAQITAPKQNNVLEFNNSVVLAPVHDKLNLGSEFTMAGWIYPSARTPYAILLGKPATDANADPWISYAIGWDQTGDHIVFVQSTGTPGTYSYIRSPNPVPFHTWTHVAATLSNGTMRLFINGQEVGSLGSPGTPQLNTVSFAIGGNQNKENNCCGSVVTIKQVGVWSRSLSGTEILNVAQTVPAADAEGLIAFWVLDEGSGQIAQDLSVNKLHGSLGVHPTADNLDPVWIDNFYADKGPFFTFKATEISPELPYPLEDIYPVDIDHDGTLEFLAFSILFPSTPYPGTFRPLQILGTGSNMTVTNKTSVYLKEKVEVVHPRQVLTADFDNNGRVDVFIVSQGTDTSPYLGEQSHLLLGQEDGTLKNVTSTHMPQAIDFTHHGAVGDIDGDGDIDIYMANIGGGEHGPRVYLNDGSGVFSVGTNNLPEAISEKHAGSFTASIFADFDNDGDPDLALGGDEWAGGNLILINDGAGHFVIKENAINKKVPGNDWITVAFTLADFDNDGDQDIITSNTPGDPVYQGAFLQLLLNDGQANFTDASERISQEFSTAGWVKWVDTTDFNNDGILDLLLSSNYAVNNSIFIGLGNARFKQVSLPLPPSDGPLRASDVDGDGDMDLVSVASNTAYVGENVQPLILPTASISSSGEVWMCEGSTEWPLLSTAANADFIYTWLKDGQVQANSNTASYQVASPGKYQVVVGYQDFPADTSLVAEVKTAALPVAAITVSGKLMTASEGVSYQWYKDDVLLDENTRTISPVDAGSYKVAVTNAAGCTAMSQAVSYTVTGVQDEIIVSYTRIYPNPTSSRLKVEIRGPYRGNISVSLVNNVGKMLLKKNVKKLGELNLTFDLAQYAGQVFFLVIETASGSSTYKVVKRG